MVYLPTYGPRGLRAIEGSLFHGVWLRELYEQARIGVHSGDRFISLCPGGNGIRKLVRAPAAARAP